jgi:uncharacterized protein DUF5069
MLARSIDKLRAQLPGGNSGTYQTKHGLTAVMLTMLGVTELDLQAIVATATSDEDVVRWLHEHTDSSHYDAINDRLSRWTLADNPPERWEHVDRLYPNRPSGPRETVNAFDLLEQDDREAFHVGP